MREKPKTLSRRQLVNHDFVTVLADSFGRLVITPQTAFSILNQSRFRRQWRSTLIRARGQGLGRQTEFELHEYIYSGLVRVNISFTVDTCVSRWLCRLTRTSYNNKFVQRLVDDQVFIIFTLQRLVSWDKDCFTNSRCTNSNVVRQAVGRQESE